MNKILRITAFCLAVVISACASVPMSDESQDAAAKTFISPTDKARIYIFRNEVYGGDTKLDLLLDGKDLGSTAARTFLYVDVPPGNYRISSIGRGGRDSTDVLAKAGDVIYVWQEAKFAFSGGTSKLHLVPEDAGKKGVLESKLIRP